MRKCSRGDSALGHKPELGFVVFGTGEVGVVRQEVD